MLSILTKESACRSLLARVLLFYLIYHFNNEYFKEENISLVQLFTEIRHVKH